MRNRRLTISVIMTLALVTTPKVWQKFNDLLAAVQHKAHAKFVDMALNSQAREYGERVLTPVAQAEEYAAACPYSQSEKVSDGSWTTPGSRLRPARTKQRAIPDSSTGPEALVFNYSRKVEKPEPSGHIASVAANHLTMRPVAFAPLAPATSKDDIVEVVTLPRPEQFAPVIIEKDPELNIKVKKALDETKGLRQKVRFVMGKNSFTLPAS